MPRLQPGKMFRWDYDYTERGEAKEGYEYGLAELDDEFSHLPESDLGSTSSYSPGAGERSPGLRSPVDEHEHESVWDGDTLASHSDHERR